MIAFNYLTVFFLQVLISVGLYLLSYSTVFANLASSSYKKFLIPGALLIQLILAGLLTKEVGDVMVSSGAGWHLRHLIDFYFIDSQHTQYPFFPFLIFLYSGLNLIQESVGWLTFSFYLKIILAVCLFILSQLINDNDSCEQLTQRWVLVTHPLTTMIIFFHRQVNRLFGHRVVNHSPLLALATSNDGKRLSQ